jgi:hypothetical protein
MLAIAMSNGVALPDRLPLVIGVELDPPPASRPANYWLDRWRSVADSIHDIRERFVTEVDDADKVPTAPRLWQIEMWVLDTLHALGQIGGNLWRISHQLHGIEDPFEGPFAGELEALTDQEHWLGALVCDCHQVIASDPAIMRAYANLLLVAADTEVPR